MADLLATLTAVSRLDRLRGRGPGWFVLHSVPLGDGHGQVHGDVDHLVVGPPGVVSINTKHHRGGRLVLDGDQLMLNGYRTAYVPKARREAQRVAAFLHATLTAAGLPEWAGRVPAWPLIVVVGGRLAVRQWPAGVTVVTSTSLIASLRGFPIALTPAQVAAVYALARRDTTWNPVSDHPAPDTTAAEHSASTARTAVPGGCRRDRRTTGEPRRCPVLAARERHAVTASCAAAQRRREAGVASSAGGGG